MNAVQAVIFKADCDGKLQSWNKYTEQFTRYTPVELHGKSVFELIAEEDRDDARQALQEVLTQGCVDIEAHVINKDGLRTLMHCVGSAIRDELGNVIAVTGIARDITHQKNAERVLREENAKQEALLAQLKETQNQLLQSEKLASIGQLAAGVAHEINNPVGYINSNVGSLKKYVTELFRMLEAYEAAEQHIADEDALKGIRELKQQLDLSFLKEDINDLMTESQEGVERVKEIVQDLKDFSHVDEGEWQWSDLHKGLESTLNIVRNEIKYKADVIKEYGQLPEVECLQSQLNQVFMNLLVNAAHAIEDYGTITLSTGLTNNDWVWVKVRDTGKGITPEELNRIFDPFFTTKPVGKGTGLGLSLSYSIVEKHGGRIEVDSEPGEGSVFTVHLPVAQSAQEAVSIVQ
jgi:PAS domain S-box-containing protein